MALVEPVKQAPRNKQLFLDSANLDDIRSIIGNDAITGVTTNPSLMAKEEKGPYADKLKEIYDVLWKSVRFGQKRHLSVEAISLDPKEILFQAKALWDRFGKNPNLELYVKVPVTFENLSVITELSRGNHIAVNATCCMTALQAKMASDAGAKIVSFFYNRMKDWTNDLPQVRHNADVEIRRYCSLRSTDDAQIICGSIRTPEDVYDCWSAGADIVTAPNKVIREMLVHPKTDEAIRQFQSEIEAWQS